MEKNEFSFFWFANESWFWKSFILMLLLFSIFHFGESYYTEYKLANCKKYCVLESKTEIGFWVEDLKDTLKINKYIPVEDENKIPIELKRLRLDIEYCVIDSTSISGYYQIQFYRDQYHKNLNTLITGWAKTELFERCDNR